MMVGVDDCVGVCVWVLSLSRFFRSCLPPYIQSDPSPEVCRI